MVPTGSGPQYTLGSDHFSLFVIVVHFSFISHLDRVFLYPVPLGIIYNN